MNPQELKEKIEAAFNDATVEVIDLTGTQDHYSVTIITPDFKGILPIKRHRMVNEVVKEELSSGAIHALQLNTYAPEEKH